MIVTSLSLALALVIVDRWPHRLGDGRLWQNHSIQEAFRFRWSSQPPPVEAQGWLDRAERLQQGQIVRSFQRLRDKRLQRRSLRQRGDLSLTNAGPGRRTKNGLQVALAVDAGLGSSPATAMPWSESSDPVLAVRVDRVVAVIGAVSLASSRLEAQRIAESWGVGAKGIVSVRDPAHPSHHVFNVVNREGEIVFLDYSASARVTLTGRVVVSSQPEQLAETYLASIDEAFAFPSIRIWRTQNVPHRSRLPDDLLSLEPKSLRATIEAELPDDLSKAGIDSVVARITAFGKISYAGWLVEQINRGSCTLLPGDYPSLVEANDSNLEPLTALDEALVTLARSGHVRLSSEFVEVTASANCRNRQLAKMFVGATWLTEPVDGLAHYTFELRIDHKARERLREAAPRFYPPTTRFSYGSRAEARLPSWVDSNRPLSPGTRKTNCWNTAASVAEYLTSGAPSSSLPIYREAPLRPTISEYLQLMKAQSTVFVADRQQCDRFVSSWAAHTHGLVVASLTDFSTHIFNVYFDGTKVRYLDGHVGVDGGFNFDIRWLRIGVVELGAMNCFESLDYQSSSERIGGSAPAREHVIAAATTAR